MAKKTEKKLTYEDAIGLKNSIPLLKIETYKDSMEFNRISDLLKGQVEEFGRKQAELYVKKGATEVGDVLQLPKDASPETLALLNKEVTDLAKQETALTKADVAFLSEEKFDWSTATKEPIPANNMGIMAKWFVKEKEGE